MRPALLRWGSVAVLIVAIAGAGLASDAAASGGALGLSASAATASVYVVHVAGPESVVVAGRGGVLATSDAGARWRNISPRAMDGVVESHIVDIESFGTARVWLELIGDERMDFVPYTDNGGATWRTGVLPGGAALSGTAPTLGFWTPESGLAVGERNGGAIALYRTDDGGGSWKQVAGATAGPFGGPVTFTSASYGWTWNRGGLVYRTDDGGRTWQQVRLPTLRGYKLTAVEQPEFFGGDVVIVIARLRTAGGTTRTAFYESGDGGASWHASLAPGAGTGASAAFARNGSDWFALSAAELFASTNAGRTWEEAGVRAPTGDSIDAIDYLSPTIGWAEAAGPPIGDLYPTYLLRTTDGGRNWSRVDFQP